MFAQTFCLDGQGLCLISPLLLLESVHLKHYSGRINMPQLVLHPLVGVHLGGTWKLDTTLWWACCMPSVVLWEKDESVCVLNIHLDGRKFSIFFLQAPLFWSKKQLSCLGRWIQSLVCRQKHVCFLVLSIVLISLLHEHLDCLHQNSCFAQEFVQTVVPTCFLKIGTHKDDPVMNWKWWNGILCC